MDDGRKAMLTPHEASPKRQKRAHPTSGGGGTSSCSVAHVAPARGKSKRPLRKGNPSAKDQVPQEQEQERSLVEVLLPAELVCHVFSMLPKGMLAIAGRTCRRWFCCCPLSYRFKFDITTLCSRLSLLKWAQQNGYSLDRYTCAAAAAQGNTSVLSWLRDEEQGCHWDELTCRGAALHGHLEVLQWLRDKGCPWSATVCSSAARNGHLELLKWARRAGCDWDEEVCRMAAKEGRLDVLRWAMEHGCPWDETACAEAARSGHLEIVKWMLDHKAGEVEFDPVFTCTYAASGGQLDVLKLLRERECQWSANVCSSAAKNGHLELLKWARQHGCPWDSQVFFKAAMNGHLEVIQWAYEQGCPWPIYTCWSPCSVSDAAASNGHVHSTYAAAAQGGQLDTLKWLREEGHCCWDEEVCVEAARNGHLEVLRWARDNGCPWDERVFRAAAAEGGHLEVLHWAQRNGRYLRVLDFLSAKHPIKGWRTEENRGTTVNEEYFAIYPNNCIVYGKLS